MLVEQVTPAALKFFSIAVGVCLAGVSSFAVLGLLPYGHHRASLVMQSDAISFVKVSSLMPQTVESGG